MKKINLNLLTAIIFSLFFSSNVYAETNNINLTSEVKDKNLIVSINSTEKIHGLIAKLSFENESLSLDNCLSDNKNVTFNSNNNILLIDSIEPIDGKILKCNFIFSKEKNYTIGLEDISISKNLKLENIQNKSTNIQAKFVKSSNQVNFSYDADDNSNPKTGSRLIYIILILIFSILIFIISLRLLRKNKQVKVVLLFLIIFPFSVYALKGDTNSDDNINDIDIKNIRNYLLGIESNKIKIANVDFDQDNKLTINDLILTRIESAKPQIIFSEEKVEGTSKYYISATRKVKITSNSEITSAKYCIATSNDCTPSVNAELENNNFEVKFSNNLNSQYICVTVTNKDKYEKNLCDTKKYFVDNETPTISTKSSIVKIDSDTNYNLKDNINVSYGVSSGELECSSKEGLIIGDNSIHCIAKGNNGTNASTDYTIKKSTTYNKTAIFFGDSITYGKYPAGYSWANYIGDKYDLKSSKNSGNSGYRISNTKTGKWINSVVTTEKSNNYDFIILHGGCNDIANDVTLGSYNATDFSGNYDTTTFIGGLEDYLYKTVHQWPNSRIGYIVNYQTPNNENRVYSKSSPYYTQMKKVLEKWKVQYIDLYFGKSGGKSYNEILKVNTNDYLPDTLHLNEEGYKVISPYIYNWMQGLKKYSVNKPF